MTGYAYTYLEYTRSKMRFPYFFKLLQASYCTYSYNTTTVLDPAVPAGMGGCGAQSSNIFVVYE